MQAIKSCIRKTKITVVGKNSVDLTKTLKTVYNQQKDSRLFYEVLTQSINKPNCCDKWEAKLNKILTGVLLLKNATDSRNKTEMVSNKTSTNKIYNCY